jgi:hypothetical protein
VRLLTSARGRSACPPFTSSAPSERQNPFLRRLDVQRYWLLDLDIHRQKVSDLRVTEPSLADTRESDARASLENLRSLVTTINQGGALASTDEFDRLLDHAVQHHGTPSDVDEWAERLASDADKFKD